MKRHASKALAALLILVMVFALAACGGDTPAGGNTGDPAGENTGAPAGDGEVYEIRLASTQADGNDLDVTLDRFAELAAEMSDGRIQITVYPGNILGDELVTTEMCQHNQLEMTMTSAGVLETFCPEFSILTLPALFEDYDHLIAALDSEWGQTLKDSTAAQDMTLLGYTCNGFMNIGTVGTPVSSIEDLNGLTIRCIESASTLTILSEWGCNPNPMAFSEVPTSLQLGAIDGCFLNPMVFLSTGIADILDYYTADWSVNIGLCPVLVNSTYFESLPQDIQDIIMEAFAQAEAEGFELTESNQQKYLDEMVAKGVELVHSTEEEIAEYYRINQEQVWPKLIESGAATQEAIDQILACAQ